MKKILLYFVFIILCSLALSPVLHAQDAEPAPEEVASFAVPLPDVYAKARVVQIKSEETIEEGDRQHTVQTVIVYLLNGPEKNKRLEISTSYFSKQAPGQKLEIGDIVVVSRTIAYDNSAVYQITDRYRLTQIYWIIAGFILLAVWLGRRRGASSLLGLIFSVLVLALYIVPKILAGANLFGTILFGSTLIITVSLFLAHGFNRRTAISLLSSLISLGLSVLLASFAVYFAQLFGMGNEDAYYLIAAGENINLQGLLLGGIIIGALGVLDDITTAQTAVVAELQHANPSLSKTELYKRGLKVGHEHIASLVNTLVLAYAGASLPIFLLFNLNQSQPLWTIFNSEFISEEIVRTMIGSCTLILSVPIATFLAAYFLTKWPEKVRSEQSLHIHHH